MGRGHQTKEKILDLAEAAILQKGFHATSIEELIAAAEITKSGFFYHFKDKNELARHLLLRYLERDDQIFTELMARADELSDDPLHSYLIMIKLLAEMLENLDTTHPGCLVASFCYQEQLFSEEIKQLNARGVLVWREIFLKKLEIIAEVYPPQEEIDLEGLADLFTTLVEGGIVMSKVLNDSRMLPKQVLFYRDYIKRIFS
ncbi:TetR/AcrR family transcriptional regulator [Emcibacter sp.]|uniref:TetR/AcrR family transcriptional regulator n=1 Tax=Emcibacter sp. TaxID=1979954 RepID=UPI003A929BE0